MNDRQVAVLPQWQERCHRRVKPEKAVEVDHILSRDGDCRTHRGVRGFCMRDDDIQTIGCAALEDHDHTLFAAGEILSSESSTRQEAWYRGHAHHRHGSIPHEYSTCDAHKTSP